MMLSENFIPRKISEMRDFSILCAIHLGDLWLSLSMSRTYLSTPCTTRWLPLTGHGIMPNSSHIPLSPQNLTRIARSVKWTS